MRSRHPGAWIVTILALLSGFTIYLFLRPHPATNPLARPTRQSPTSTAGPERNSSGSVKIENATPRSPGTNNKSTDLYHCHTKLLRVMSAWSALHSCESSGLSPNAYNSCQLTRTADEQRYSELEAAASGCAPDALEPRKFYAAVRKRALAGDIQAQRCYIAGEFAAIPDNAQITEDQMSEYRSLAPRLIERAFDRGDWEIVEWLSRGPLLDVRDGLLSSAYPLGKPSTLYKMRQLLRLGATDPAEIAQLTRGLKYMGEPANGELTSTEKRDAEDWATRVFNSTFSATLTNRTRMAEGFRWCE